MHKYSEYEEYPKDIDWRAVKVSEPKRVELDPFKVAVASRVSKDYLHAVRFRLEERQWELGLDLLAQVEATVYGEKLPDRDIPTYPADWWEAFKDRWFPKWALKRWPVRRDSVKIEAARIYADIHPTLRNDNKVVVLQASHKSYFDQK